MVNLDSRGVVIVLFTCSVMVRDRMCDVIVCDVV